MKRKNATRRALFTSMLSLLLCVTMFVGTTFAWFTDEVKSGINTITAGNLDVELEYAKIANGQITGWEKVNGNTKNIFDPNALWEPGRVEVAYLKVSNLGTLALKYQLGVNVAKETPGISVETNKEFNLSDHLVFKVVEMADAVTVYTDREAVQAAAGTEKGLKDYNGETKALDPKDGTNDEDYVALIVYMPETVGNEANYRGEKPVIELGVNLFATQVEAESDSFDETYDENAWNDAMKVFTAADLKAALNNGGKVMVMADIDLKESLVIPAGIEASVNLNGKTIAGTGLDVENEKSPVIVNKGILEIANGTVKSTGTNGGSAINNTGKLTLKDATIVGAPSDTSTGTASYTVNTDGVNSKLEVFNSNISGRGAIGATNGTTVEINGGTYHTPAVAWGHAIYAFGEGTEVVINDGTFSEGYEMAGDNWGMYQIYSGKKAKVTVNGGYFPEWDCANGYDLCTATEGVIEIYGGTFADDPSNQNGKNYVAEGALIIDNQNGTKTVVNNTSDSIMTLTNGAVLDLDGEEFAGTVVALGDLTIEGDTKIKTLSATNGGIITIEEDKTLTLNNFSFGSKDNNTAEYTITGGTVTANYGFFQHGKYTLAATIKTGYMYYSFGSDITVTGTVHSQGLGDGLDYVRGNVTIANGGKSIHEKSLWVGQPASWGAMNASLTVEEGGYVQANSLSVHDGSVMYNSAANIGKDNTGVKYNTLSGSIITVAGDTAGLQAALDGATTGTTIQLAPGVAYGAVNVRPTADNETTMYCGEHNYTTTDAEEFKAHLAESGYHTTPKYTTDVKDVTIIGAEGATVAGLVATSGHAYGDVYDYVRDKDFNEGSAYYNTLNINNLAFKDVNFTGKIDINTSDADSVYDGVTFDGCTFTTGGTASTNGSAIRYYNESNNGKVKNIVVNDCQFSNCYQGVYVHHVNGLTVTGCTFDTTGHNAIALQGHGGAVNLKNVVITGNQFANIGDRVIRFNEVGADSSITIQNNVATNSGNSSNQVMKAESIAAGVTTSISGNNWGVGKIVANDELKDK